MRSSDEFEIKVSRIHELLDGSSGEVTWNDHIPDPDNPKQNRQIDVTVRKDGVLTLIECRETKSVQNVKWIEELIGRKKSLHADTVIGVSSSGFTANAQNKASKQEIVLHTLQSITDNDVATWVGHITLSLFYYQYSDLTFSLCVKDSSLPKLHLDAVVDEFRSSPLFQQCFNAAALELGKLHLLAEEDERRVRFGVRCGLQDVYVIGEPVIQLELEGVACLRRMPILLPKQYLYRALTPNQNGKVATLESSQIGETSVVRRDNQVAINIELSTTDMPPLSQIRYIRAQSNEELEHEIFAITNPEKLRVSGRFGVKLFGM